MATGIVVRFDELRGYGFITPDTGTEDVFMHANDLLDDKYLFRPGLRVAFEVEDGDRGLKASDVRIVEGDGAPARPAPASVSLREAPAVRETRAEQDGDEGMCDVLSAEELRREVTESALKVTPSLTGEQILDLRARMVKLAQAHRWLDS